MTTTLTCAFCGKKPILVRAPNVFACCGIQAAPEGWGMIFGRLKAMSIYAMIGKQAGELIPKNPMCPHEAQAILEQIRALVVVEDPELPRLECEDCKTS